MGKKIATLVMGILFGLSLFSAFYIFFVLGLALGIATGNNVLFYISYLFIPLGILAIAGSALILKNIKASKIMLIIPTICFLLATIYTIIMGAYSILYLIFMIIIFALGLVPTILLLTIKKEEKHILAHLGDVTADKDTMKLDSEE